MSLIRARAKSCNPARNSKQRKPSLTKGMPKVILAFVVIDLKSLYTFYISCLAQAIVSQPQ